MEAGEKILAGLREAVKGEFTRIRIAGQTWVRIPDCPGCAKVSNGRPPQTKHFHHPLCEERKKCAECGGEISGLFCEHLSQEVGAICATCYGSKSETGEAT